MKSTTNLNKSPFQKTEASTNQIDQYRSLDVSGIEEDGIPSVCFSGQKLGTWTAPLSLISSLHLKYSISHSGSAALGGCTKPTHSFTQAEEADGSGCLPELRKHKSVSRICSLSNSLIEHIYFENKKAENSVSDLSFQLPMKNTASSSRACSSTNRN